ncbi:Cysteinyl-tRNA synthetase [Ceratobasidium theobromae]|uniref:cysteine--tRNA ligase n=1 Tax=Ceratobasidium theobromae TaxID=1582974 RepID=A0A5N5QH19_9AGAM|nr:Cysteinyl-tRNA synthetase [Ceratobasidium theobromae]
MADKSRQPEWIQPQRHGEPVLKVYNSLTKSKTEFVPKSGRNVTWYNCGPTVYDSSHMGHARNYLTQDIIRRILTDYFGYDVHFVMNITDIDDKIILRARHQYHLDTLSASTPNITPDLIASIEKAWIAYLNKQLSKGLEDKNLIVSGQEAASWEKIEVLAQDPAWVQAGNARDEKFFMHLKALRDTHASLSSARNNLGTPSNTLVNASAPILAPYLDALHLASPNASPIPSHITRALSTYWERAFMRDMDRLGVKRPDTLTRVTEYVPEIVAFVEKIITRGWAYKAGGSIYFDVRAYDGVKSKDNDWEHVYAKLQPHSKNNTALLEEGEGALSSSDSKRAPADFALWKRSKPGEPEWPSPWGPGRPGWHIECSVMATAILGDGMDIHSGGIDLAFPHHDNEIAQSEAYHDCRQWVNYFLHTGHLHIEGQKMSKSLKNFITVEDALKMYSARQLRLAFLAQPWSAKMDFKESLMVEVRSQETVFNNFFALARALVRDEEVAAEGAPSIEEPRHNYSEAEAELTALYVIVPCDLAITNTNRSPPLASITLVTPHRLLLLSLSQTQHAYRVALCDSFNTPEAMQRVLELVSRANAYVARGRSRVNVGVVAHIARWVTKALKVFGLSRDASEAIGWGTDGSVQEGSVDREALLMPYLRTMSSFRDSVRQLAISGAPAKDILALCDKLRDVDLIPLGVALDDQDDGKALVKLVPPETLIKARDEKLAIAAERAAKKAAQADAAKAKQMAKLERGKLSPIEMFQPPNVPEGTYGSWDDRGVPLTDASGADLPKSRLKKLAKEWEIQSKAHDEWKTWVAANEQ